MKLNTLLQGLIYAEPVLCATTLLAMARRQQLRQYVVVSTMLVFRLCSSLWLMFCLFWAGRILERHAAYHLYFYTYWGSYAVESLLMLATIYSIYRLAMAPLKGLQTLGTLMFRWAAGIAVAIAVTMAFGPHVSGMRFIVRAVSQLQQTESVLTLCMLLFVCLAIRPMGLSFGSKVFGICLGLGVMATTDLAVSAWFSHMPQLSSSVSVITGLSVQVAILIWTAYFIAPEPKRRMIVLPTTSPFLRWNQISMALGDAPGYVALGEVHPDMFAPAEVEIMRRASLKISGAALG